MEPSDHSFCAAIVGVVTETNAEAAIEELKAYEVKLQSWNILKTTSVALGALPASALQPFPVTATLQCCAC